MTHWHEVVPSILDERELVTSTAGLSTREDLKARCLQSSMVLLDGWHVNSAKNSLGTEHDFLVGLVRHIQGGQGQKFENGELRAWLHHARNLHEEAWQVLDVSPCLDLVNTVKRLVSKGQRIVEATNVKLKLRAEQSRLIGEVGGLLDLGWINVETHNLGTSVACNVVCHLAASATGIKHFLAGTHGQLICLLLLIHELVANDPT
mmetsp:Transcript_69913/g.167821  ORF Transcript_69913/g.167821 Transcript_69913/m.167821 type:complete len:205 (-) Transcript_69913:421-1035(-)